MMYVWWARLRTGRVGPRVTWTAMTLTPPSWCWTVPSGTEQGTSVHHVHSFPPPALWPHQHRCREESELPFCPTPLRAETMENHFARALHVLCARRIAQCRVRVRCRGGPSCRYFGYGYVAPTSLTMTGYPGAVDQGNFQVRVCADTTTHPPLLRHPCAYHPSAPPAAPSQFDWLSCLQWVCPHPPHPTHTLTHTHAAWTTPPPPCFE